MPPLFASFSCGPIRAYGLIRALQTAAAAAAYDANYKYSAFQLRVTSPTTYSATNLPPTIDYLVVGGGGGGGGAQGGGGGGGGYRSGTSYPLSSPTSYTIIVGAGGATDSNGTNSGFYSTGTSLWASGGGAGQYNNGNAGGSGGGGGAQAGAKVGGAGNIGGYSPSEGSAGGNSTAPCAGGGGGATATGGNGAAPAGGTGGAGANSSISGTDTGYSGGGGGGTYPSSTGGVGALSTGGSSGTNSNATAGDARQGRGGGGGGGGSTPGVGNGNGGKGGSGAVIIRYPNTYSAANAVGGAYVNTGGYHIYRFYTTGTFGFTSTTPAPSNNNVIIDSASNIPITSNGTVSQGTFSPFQSYAYYVPSGNYIWHQRDDTIYIGKEDFSIEAWVCRTGAPGGRNWPVFLIDAGGNWLEFGFANSIYGGVIPVAGTFGLCAGDTGIAWTNTVLATNTWYKVKAQRMGGNFQIYLNEALEKTTADTTVYDFGSSGGAIAKIGFNGYAYSWDQRYYDGYVSDLVVKRANTVIFTTAGVGANATSTQNFYNSISGNTSNTPTIIGGGISIYTGNSGFMQSNTSNVIMGTPYTQTLLNGSGYFSGGNYLTIPPNASITAGVGDFTLEFQVYHTSGIGSTHVYFNQQSGGLSVYRNTSGKLQIDRDGIVGALTSNYTIYSDRWHTISISRKNGTLRMIINGNIDNSTSTSYDFTGSGNFAIGASPGGGNAHVGYLANMRYSTDGIYTTNYVPSPYPLTLTPNTSLLLSFTNFGIKDVSPMRNVIRTSGTIGVNTSCTKFGGGSAYFNGSSDYIYLPATKQISTDSKMAVGTGDFTIHGWIMPQNWNSSGAMITQGGTGAPQFAKYGTANNLGLAICGVSWLITDAYLPYVGKWSHVVCTRKDGFIKIFIDGVQSGSTVASNYNFTAITEIGIGDDLASSYFAGNIEDLQVIPGKSLWFDTFTPPTRASYETGLYNENTRAKNFPSTVELFMVGGGGGGGNGGPSVAYESGGGGAGGLIYMGAYSTASSVFAVTIGAGGVYNANGSNTTVVTNIEKLTALGGGKSTNNSGNGNSGGSGGGGTHNGTSGAAGVQTTNPSISSNSRTYGFGTNGGNGGPSSGGGGGGAGAAGSSASGPVGGKGGDGKQYPQFAPYGANTNYFAGGGVGAYGPAGGLGGGGGIPPGWTVGTNGTPATGGGGGGGAGAGSAIGGSGGSGIVIIRYPSTFDLAYTTGYPTVNTSNGYYMIAFTSSGSISFN